MHVEETGRFGEHTVLNDLVKHIAWTEPFEHIAENALREKGNAEIERWESCWQKEQNKQGAALVVDI
ncbi:hypothetical protein N7462_004427 [Penicillium macrosclerotiorum]|uniref:uncharacterized protein n=1 Tax=Penicillium macrosclerotiorum TaxID=303699 RepID=UPI0025498505|nr:uncharacterized protein N7462_004427 [Penicillium macrosclerotiorum]KAJ5690035.1 hypothetical protein N7462_004427 [Penicillium macrosclerotiorum]